MLGEIEGKGEGGTEDEGLDASPLSLLLSGQENARALDVGAITGIVIGVLLVLTF